MTAIQILVLSTLAILILRWPHLGLAFTAASLPVVDILPSIGLFTSVIPLIGLITLGSYFLHRLREREKPLFRFHDVHILGLLFICWLYISNPYAAWFGFKRNWILTAIQLWALAWLASELLDTSKKHEVLMWLYSIVTAVSALIAIQQGEIRDNVDASLRSAGLADGANDAARYFVIAIVFFNYLRTSTKNRIARLLAILGLIVTFLGVFFTVSRTGILLLFTVIGLQVLLQRQRKYQFQQTLVFIIAIFFLWQFSSNIITIVRTIIPSIHQGTDTVGIRYGLWQAGWRMWLDHILKGVGVGMYPEQLIYYGWDILPVRALRLVTHNMYIQVLAETGIIGFGIFVFLIFRSFRNFRSGEIPGETNSIQLRNAWLIAFLAMLLGGITKSDHFDKLLWLAIGISACFQNQSRVKIQKKTLYHATKKLQA